MTVNTTQITSGPYPGNDIADTFDYDFRIEDKTQLIVYETDDLGVETILTVDTDYTVAGIGVDAGGTVTRVAGALPTGYEWYIRSDYKQTQLTAFASQGGFFPDVHEEAMDKLTFLIQQITDILGRSMRVSESYTGGTINALPDPEAQKYLRWKSDLSGFENVLLGSASLNLPVVQLSSYADLASAISAIGSTETELWIDASDTSINSPAVIPANISIRHIIGNILDGSSTLTFVNNSLISSFNQLFGSSLTVLGHIKSKGLTPHLWGAAGDGVTIDSAPLLLWAAHLIADGANGNSVVGLIPGGFDFLSNSQIPVGSNVTFTGGGTISRGPLLPDDNELIKSALTDGTINVFENENVIFDGFTIDGRDHAVAEIASTQSMVKIHSTENLIIRNMTLKDHRRTLFAVHGCKNVKIINNNASGWGFTSPGGSGDGGAAFFVSWNYVDFTLSENVVISGNIITEGRWNGIACYANDVVISKNVLRDIGEAGIFIRRDAGGGECKDYVVSNNIVENIYEQYIDASGIVFTAENGVLSDNLISNTEAYGISMGAYTKNVKVDGNTLIDCMLLGVSYATEGGQITLRNVDGLENPEYVSIINNLIKDTSGTRVAPRGVSVYQPSGTPVALVGIEISGNKLVASAVSSNDPIYFEAALQGNFCEVGSNLGSYIRIGTQSTQVIYRISANVDFTSIAANSSQNQSVTVPGSILSTNDVINLGLPANGFANGLALKAYVFDADTIRIQALNVTGAAIDPNISLVKFEVCR